MHPRPAASGRAIIQTQRVQVLAAGVSSNPQPVPHPSEGQQGSQLRGGLQRDTELKLSRAKTAEAEACLWMDHGQYPSADPDLMELERPAPFLSANLGLVSLTALHRGFPLHRNLPCRAAAWVLSGG